MNKSAIIAGGGNKNEPFDYYPTPPEATHALMMHLGLSGKVVWEPACGAGAMSVVISDYGNEVISSDVRHTGYGDGGVDFLTCAGRQCDWIITNPPFALAQQFIERALDSGASVAMLLKAHYWHASRRAGLFSARTPSKVLPLTWRPNFMASRGTSPTMDFQWTVWEAEHTGPCRYELLMRPNT